MGHPFFWCLRAEMHVPEVSERFGLLIEEYLRCCGPHRQQLLLQYKVEGLLKEAAIYVKQVCACHPTHDVSAMCLPSHS